MRACEASESGARSATHCERSEQNPSEARGELMTILSFIQIYRYINKNKNKKNKNHFFVVDFEKILSQTCTIDFLILPQCKNKMRS